MKVLFVALVLSFVLVSCASYKPPKEYPAEKVRIINKNYDDTWKAIIKWFGENGTSIKNIDKSSGFISTDYGLSVANSNIYCDCGEMGFGQTLTDQTGNFNLTVEKVSDDSTRVNVNMFFKAIIRFPATQYSPPQASPVDCNSKGVLETKLFDYISK